MLTNKKVIFFTRCKTNQAGWIGRFRPLILLVFANGVANEPCLYLFPAAESCDDEFANVEIGTQTVVRVGISNPLRLGSFNSALACSA